MSNGTVKKTKKSKKPRQKVNWLLAVLIVGVTLYVSFVIVDQHVKINNARAELSKIEDQIFTQTQTNEELKKVADAVDEAKENGKKNSGTVDTDDDAFADYVEKIARDEFDYVKNGEVVFVNIAGD